MTSSRGWSGSVSGHTRPRWLEEVIRSLPALPCLSVGWLRRTLGGKEGQSH